MTGMHAFVSKHTVYDRPTIVLCIMYFVSHIFSFPIITFVLKLIAKRQSRMRNFTRCMYGDTHSMTLMNTFICHKRQHKKCDSLIFFYTKFMITFVQFTHLGQYKRLHTSVNSTRPVSRQVVYCHWFKPLEQTVSSTAIRAEFAGIRILRDC